MKITVEWLQAQGACPRGIDAFQRQKETCAVKLVKTIIRKKDHLPWANWLLIRVMSRKQCVSYAIFAAEQVLYLYEQRYPNDNRPRKAVEAAKAAYTHVTDDADARAADAVAYATARAADDAARAAADAYARAADDATARAADAAAASAHAAAAAADAITDTADASAHAAADTIADTAYAAAANVAAAAAAAAADAYNMKITILEYGLSLLRHEEKMCKFGMHYAEKRGKNHDKS